MINNKQSALGQLTGMAKNTIEYHSTYKSYHLKLVKHFVFALRLQFP